jgi:hypothetical protein
LACSWGQTIRCARSSWLLGAQLLIVAALFQLADAAQVMALGLLRGVQDTRVPMIYAVVSYWLVGMPCAYVFGFTLGWGAPGIWWGLVVGLVLAGGLMIWRFWSGPAQKVASGDVAADLATRACRSYPVTRCVLGSSRVFRYLIAFLVASLALPALAQDLPNLREARGLVFAEDGAVSWEVIADPALTEADLVTLDQINQVQPQPYYAALALAPDAGLASEFTALAANYHDEANARAAALAACEANRNGAGRALHRGAGHPPRRLGAGPPPATVGAGHGGAAE